MNDNNMLEFHEKEHKNLFLKNIGDYDGVYTCSYCLDLFYEQETNKHQEHNNGRHCGELCVICYSSEWKHHMFHYEDIFDLFGDNVTTMYYISCRFCKFIAHENQECIPSICDYCIDAYKSHFSSEYKELGKEMTKYFFKPYPEQMQDYWKKKYIEQLAEQLMEKNIFLQCQEQNNCYICHIFFHSNNNNNHCRFYLTNIENEKIIANILNK